MNAKIICLTMFAITLRAVDAGQSAPPVNQPEVPKIAAQPQDQLVPLGSTAVFVVQAQSADAYQWSRNGTVINGATNSNLIIPRAGLADVGRYSCDVFEGMESVPTSVASLMVFTDSTDPKTGVDPIVVYTQPVASSGSQGTCPGSYTGYANYSNGSSWGWAPITTDTVFTASDTNRTNTKVLFTGFRGDSGCNQTTVTIPNPPASPLYQFEIFFTNNVPTNAYGITLTGFHS
jgi:hypothetical protein